MALFFIYVPVIRFKSTCIVYAADHAGVGGICDECFPGWGNNVNLRDAGHQWICAWRLSLPHGLINQ